MDLSLHYVLCRDHATEDFEVNPFDWLLEVDQVMFSGNPPSQILNKHLRYRLHLS
jgi:hypothetical protein